MPVSGRVRALLATGPLAHLVTINPDGSPQVSCVWVGVDGHDFVTAHLISDQVKLRNVGRDPRVALSLDATAISAPGRRDYLVVHGTAQLETGGAPELLRRLAEVYMGPDAPFPPDDAPPGAVMRITATRYGGVGRWDH